jgi:hypothetical protein
MSSRTAFMAAIVVVNLPRPARAHDIYSPLRVEGGERCYDDQECRPALHLFTAHGVQMFVDQQRTKRTDPVPRCWVTLAKPPVNFGAARSISPMSAAKASYT